MQKHNPVFITGTAGMGKSELAKTYAKKNKKKYTNIVHLFYSGDLKKCVAHVDFSDNTAGYSLANYPINNWTFCVIYPCSRFSVY